MSEDSKRREGELIARLLSDSDFRAEFRRDPAGVCRAAGIDDVAAELMTGERGFQTLEVRESRSSLAGVLLAAAAEGVALGHVIEAAASAGPGPAADTRGAAALSHALTHVKLKAIDPSQVRQGAGADHAADVLAFDPNDPPPTCSVCIARRGRAPEASRCMRCGAHTALGEVICGDCVVKRSPRAARSMAAVRPQEAGLHGKDSVDSVSRGGGGSAAAELITASSGAGGAPPIDVRYLAGSNEGGVWHGSEFMMRDAEGAPGADGSRYHAAYDLFAQPEAPVRAPAGGTVVEVTRNPNTSGQIFGGVVKVQTAEGKVWVFRHVTPSDIQEGQTVRPGQLIANVSAWTGGATHTHVELWKSYSSSNGYRIENMEDPLPSLKALYGAPGASLPPEGFGANEVVTRGGGPAPDLSGLTGLSVPDDAAAVLARGAADPRAATLLSKLAGVHELGVASARVEEDRTVIVISGVGGKPVDQGNVGARDLVEQLVSAPEEGRSIASPWPVRGAGAGATSQVPDRIEISYGPTSEPAAPGEAGAPEGGPGRETGIFAGMGTAPPSGAGAGASLAAQPAVEALSGAGTATGGVPSGSSFIDPAGSGGSGSAVDASADVATGGGSGSAGSLTDDQVRGARAIIAVYEQHGLDPVAGIAVALSESGLRPDAAGDIQGGVETSFGLFQLHKGGALGSLTPEQAKDPVVNAGVAARALVELGAAGKSTEEQVRIQVTGFERPADPVGRVVQDSANIEEARRIYQSLAAAKP